MKHKSLKLAAVALLSVITLAGCSGGNADVATMKGAKITENDLFNELKKNPQTGEALTNMIITKIATENYGKDVDDKAVDKQFKEVEDQYGGKKPFEDVLKQSGLDAKTFKTNIKNSLSYEAMLKSHIKITDEDLKAEWATFHPAVDAQIMSFDTKEDADKALEAVNKDGGDFDKVAKDSSTDTVTKEDGGKVTFDSTMVTTPANVMIPQEVKDAAYKLEDGKVSDVIQTQNMQTGTDAFYIVKMVKNTKKGNDYKPFEKELKELAEAKKLQDPAFVQKVVGEELEKANVKIKDPQFKDILVPYLPQKEEATEDTKADDAKKDDAKKDDAKKEDSKKEDSTETSK